MYNTTPFHHAWACFGCRKSFKKALWPSYRSSSQPVVVCPDCKGHMKYMGRDFAAPKQSNVKAWQETWNWLLQKELPKVAFMTWDETLQNECISSQKKASAKQARQLARAAWIKKTKRKRYLKNLDKWTKQQDT